MKRVKRKDHLVWIDLEMTGLDPDRDRIIEIASFVTDGDLKLIAYGPCLVIHQPPKVLNTMDQWNQKQHRKSGLLEEVKRSHFSVKDAESLTLEFLRSTCFPKASPLCGNAVHHDRRFLIKYMPRVHQFLHYRHIDVSTVKSLIHRWFPKGKKFLKKKTVSHRALPDILDSVEELKFYRKVYFKSLSTGQT